MWSREDDEQKKSLVRHQRKKDYGAIEQAIPLQDIKSDLALPRHDERCLDYYPITYYGRDADGKMVYEYNADEDAKVQVQFLHQEPDCFLVTLVAGKKYANCLYMPRDDFENPFAVRFCMDQQNGLWVKRIEEIPPAEKIRPKQASSERPSIYCLSRIVNLDKERYEVMVDFADTVRFHEDKNEKIQLISGQCQSGTLYIKYPEGVPLREKFFSQVAYRYMPEESILAEAGAHFVGRVIEQYVSHPPMAKKALLPERNHSDIVTYGRVLAHSFEISTARQIVVDNQFTVQIKLSYFNNITLMNTPKDPHWSRFLYTPIGRFQDGSIVSFANLTELGAYQEFIVAYNRRIVPRHPKVYRFTRVEHYHSRTSVFEVDVNDRVEGYFLPEPYKNFIVRSGKEREGQLYVKYKKERKFYKKHQAMMFTHEQGVVVLDRVDLAAQNARSTDAKKQLVKLYPVLTLMPDDKQYSKKAHVDSESHLICSLDPLIIHSGKYKLHTPYVDERDKYNLYQFEESDDGTLTVTTRFCSLSGIIFTVPAKEEKKAEVHDQTILLQKMDATVDDDQASLIRQENEQYIDYYRITFYASEKDEMIYEIDIHDKLRVEFRSQAPDCLYVNIVEGKKAMNGLYTSFGLFHNRHAVYFCQDENGVWAKCLQEIPRADKIIKARPKSIEEEIYCLSPIVHTNEARTVVDFTQRIRFKNNKTHGISIISGVYDKNTRYIEYNEGIPLKKPFVGKVTVYRLSQSSSYYPNVSSYRLEDEKVIDSRQIFSGSIPHPAMEKPLAPIKRGYLHAVTYARVLTAIDDINSGKAKKLTVDYKKKLKMQFTSRLFAHVKLISKPEAGWEQFSYTPLGPFQDGSVVKFKAGMFNGEYIEDKYKNLPIPEIVPFSQKIYRFARIEHYHSSASVFYVNGGDYVSGYYYPGDRQHFIAQQGVAYEGKLYFRYREDDPLPLGYIGGGSHRAKSHQAYLLVNKDKDTLIPNPVSLFARYARSAFIRQNKYQKELFNFYPILDLTTDGEDKNLKNARVDYDSPITCMMDPFIVIAGKYELNLTYLGTPEANVGFSWKGNQEDSFVITLVEDKDGILSYKPEWYKFKNIVSVSQEETEKLSPK